MTLAFALHVASNLERLHLAQGCDAVAVAVDAAAAVECTLDVALVFVGCASWCGVADHTSHCGREIATGNGNGMGVGIEVGGKTSCHRVRGQSALAIHSHWPTLSVCGAVLPFWNYV